MEGTVFWLSYFKVMAQWLDFLKVIYSGLVSMNHYLYNGKKTIQY